MGHDKIWKNLEGVKVAKTSSIKANAKVVKFALLHGLQAMLSSDRFFR